MIFVLMLAKGEIDYEEDKLSVTVTVSHLLDAERVVCINADICRKASTGS